MLTQQFFSYKMYILARTS